KFTPGSDEPHTIIDKHPEFSTYTLDIPNQPKLFPPTAFHASELEPYIENDDVKFPSRKKKVPPPVMVYGVEEFCIDGFIDERQAG
ncbi:hypothetical protein B0H19DRAFT_930755, partial [Mycena capillaripes]